MNSDNTGFTSTGASSEAEKTTNKRTIEELFGDIDDLLYASNDPKKRKQCENESDFALIDRIVGMRKLARQGNVSNILLGDHPNDLNSHDRNNLSLTVPNFPFIGVTRQDGQRIYVRFHSSQYEVEERDRIVLEINDSLNLKNDLWNEAEALFNNQIEKPEDTQYISKYNHDADTKLLVDVFKPRRYLELLSDESINRIMLRWLKLWDKVVFNKLPKVKVTKKIEEKKFKVAELCTDLDEHSRYGIFIILVSGYITYSKASKCRRAAKYSSQ